MPSQAQALPVLVLTGFLGAGKTTLLNRILSQSAGPRWAVLVNEFGSVGIDGRLVVRADEQVIELSNGCLCCTLRGDLLTSLTDLLKRRQRRWFAQPFDRLVIETSGLASPGPIVQTLALMEPLASELRLSAVVTLCHAQHIGQQLAAHPEAAEQVGYADVLLLNHRDQVQPAELARAQTLLQSLNPLAQIQTCERAEVDVDRLLHARGSVTGRDPQAATSSLEWPLGPLTLAESAPAEREALEAWSPLGTAGAIHSSGAQAVVLESQQRLELHRLKLWLKLVTRGSLGEVWRLKGILRTAEVPGPVLVQGVYQWLEIGPGPGDPPQLSQLVLIGRGLNRPALELGFQSLLAPATG
jgi:G3E family GTPase